MPGVFERGILGAIYAGAGVRAIGLEVLGIADSAFFTGGLDTGVSAPLESDYESMTIAAGFFIEQGVGFLGGSGVISSESDYESIPIEVGFFIGLGVGFLAGEGCVTAPIAPFQPSDFSSFAPCGLGVHLQLNSRSSESD